jgi:hypothetical protein
MRDIREELEQEASFWREMIEQGDTDEPALQRMRDALLLAEFKLAKMMDSYH